MNPTEPNPTLGYRVNEKILRLGVFALVDLKGDRIWFYPRGALPSSMYAYLDSQEGRYCRALRDFCVNLGRGLA